MKHAKHDMHANSLAAYREEIERLKGRARQVFDYVALHGRSTDRQIMVGLAFTDPNMVRPRISELVKMGLLIECGGRRDPATGKRVRQVDIPANQPDLF